MSTNLAGVDSKEADRVVRLELAHSRIEIVESADAATGEVKTHLSGRLGSWTFRRAWYYWVANGHMPVEKARELWADPLGKDTVRVGGHCGCPSPDEYGTEYFDADGLRLYVKRDGENPEKWGGYGTEWRCVADPKAESASAFVTCYHVDSEAGLRLLADAIRDVEKIGK